MQTTCVQCKAPLVWQVVECEWVCSRCGVVVLQTDAPGSPAWTHDRFPWAQSDREQTAATITPVRTYQYSPFRYFARTLGRLSRRYVGPALSDRNWQTLCADWERYCTASKRPSAHDVCQLLHLHPPLYTWYGRDAWFLAERLQQQYTPSATTFARPLLTLMQYHTLVHEYRSIYRRLCAIRPPGRKNVPHLPTTIRYMLERRHWLTPELDCVLPCMRETARRLDLLHWLDRAFENNNHHHG